MCVCVFSGDVLLCNLPEWHNANGKMCKAAAAAAGGAVGGAERLQARLRRSADGFPALNKALHVTQSYEQPLHRQRLGTAAGLLVALELICSFR